MSLRNNCLRRFKPRPPAASRVSLDFGPKSDTTLALERQLKVSQRTAHSRTAADPRLEPATSLQAAPDASAFGSRTAARGLRVRLPLFGLVLSSLAIRVGFRLQFPRSLACEPQEQDTSAHDWRAFEQRPKHRHGGEQVGT